MALAAPVMLMAMVPHFLGRALDPTEARTLRMMELLLSAPFVRGVRMHGTGCTYSAAIVAYLALGCDVVTAVGKAKGHISRAIEKNKKTGKHTILNNYYV